MLVDGLARILDGIAERTCGSAHHQISRTPVENRNFVLAQNERLAALMVENYDVVSSFLLVIHHHLIAALAEGLDNFCCLRTGAAIAGTAETIRRSSGRRTDFPGLAISDEHSRCTILRRFLFSSGFGSGKL